MSSSVWCGSTPGSPTWRDRRRQRRPKPVRASAELVEPGEVRGIGQAERAGGADVRGRRSTTPSATRRVAGSMPYGCRPTRTSGTVPRPMTNRLKKSRVARTVVLGEHRLHHLLHVVAQRRRPQRDVHGARLGLVGAVVVDRRASARPVDTPSTPASQAPSVRPQPLVGIVGGSVSKKWRKLSSGSSHQRVARPSTRRCCWSARPCGSSEKPLRLAWWWAISSDSSAAPSSASLPSRTPSTNRRSNAGSQPALGEVDPEAHALADRLVEVDHPRQRARRPPGPAPSAAICSASPAPRVGTHLQRRPGSARRPRAAPAARRGSRAAPAVRAAATPARRLRPRILGRAAASTRSGRSRKATTGVMCRRRLDGGVAQVDRLQLAPRSRRPGPRPRRLLSSANAGSRSARRPSTTRRAQNAAIARRSAAATGSGRADEQHVFARLRSTAPSAALSGATCSISHFARPAPATADQRGPAARWPGRSPPARQRWVQ